jgi:hypothetical protein
MNSPSQGPRPHRAAERLVELAALALPRGDVRRRYQREFVAELHGLSALRQIRHALGVLLSVRSLRAAVTTDDYTQLEDSMGHVNLRRPVMCRLNLRHHWQTGQTEDGEQYIYCVRCDKLRDQNLAPLGTAGALNLMGGNSPW